MLKFNDHQLRLWNRMIYAIEDYKNNAISFSKLVSELHGALQASEFKDEQLIKEWYNLWGSLEIHNAVKGDTINKEKVIKDLEDMRNFLIEQLENQ